MATPRGKDSSSATRELQLKLKAAGYFRDEIDGEAGPSTIEAMHAFQHDYEWLEQTDTPNAATLAALDQALLIKKAPSRLREPPTEAPESIVPCSEKTWQQFQDLVTLVTTTPIRYGPGRGLFHNGSWMITYGPGALGRKTWPTLLDHRYPSFHCTSWINFFLGWLLRYDARFTHAGNIPDLWDLCESSSAPHKIPGGGVYRGYGPHCREISSNGDTAVGSPGTELEFAL